MRKEPLLRPSYFSAFLYAFRTTIASLVALAIAFWMELGQPQWAAMTVWIVAQSSPGMSLSKGRWRIVGTCVGMVGAIWLVGFSPQAPWMFFLLLALWLGLCAGFASMTQNFRGYAVVLAGYTGAIIALSAVDQPDQVFNIAIARGTYILLGVVCEMVAGMMFVSGTVRKARRELQGRVSTVLSHSTSVLSAVMRDEEGSIDQLCNQLSSLQSVSDQLEFIRIEMHGYGHEVDRAYVTFGGVAVMLSRGLGLRSRMASVGPLGEELKADLETFAQDMSNLSAFLAIGDHADQALEKAELLLAHCRDKLAVYLTRHDQETIKDGVVLTGVEVMLQDLCEALSVHCAGEKHVPLSGHHRLHRHVDKRLAFSNSVRSMVAILLGALVWEVTAWPHGALFVTFIAVVCTRFSTFDNTVLASRRFFYGAVWAVIAGIIPVFIVMPITSSYVVLGMTLGFFMFLGGLALRYPPTAVMAASYANFFPWVLGLDNQGRYSELDWFNVSLALLLGLWCGVLVFRTVLPITVRHAWRLMRRELLDSLHHITRHDEDVTHYDWVDDTTQRLEQVFHFVGQLPQKDIDHMIHGTLAIVTVGRNMLMLRQLVQEGRLPKEAEREGEALMNELTSSNVENQADKALVSSNFQTEQESLSQFFWKTSNLTVRRDIVLAMGSLRIMRFELPRGQSFLTQPMISSETKSGLG